MGRDRLARVLAQRYGYKVTAVEDALASGRRIRVRAGLDEASAQKLKGDLEALGGIVVLVDPAERSGPTLPPGRSDPTPSGRFDAPLSGRFEAPLSGVPVRADLAPSSRVPAARPDSGRVAVTPSTGRPAGPAPGRPDSGRVATPASTSGPRAPTTVPPRAPTTVPPRTPPARKDTPFPGGLGEVDVPELGALAGASGRFQLSALDGSDGGSPPPAAASGAPGLPATFAPASTPAAFAPAPPPPPGPGDLFGPPGGEELAIELQELPQKRGTLAVDKPAAPPPVVAEVRQSGPVPAPAAVPPPAPPPERAASPLRALRLPAVDPRAMLRDPRGRLAAGVALGLLIGFLPAHLYALHAEDKLDDIRLELVHQPPPQTDAEYELAVSQFDLARERMLRVRNRIAVVAGVLWLLAGAGVCYGFFRLVPEET